MDEAPPPMPLLVPIPTLGDRVLYRLDALDAETINRRRVSGSAIAAQMAAQPPTWPLGAQAHQGTPVKEGDTLPMIVTRVWEGLVVNGQVLLDGNDVLWVISVPFGVGARAYTWPVTAGRRRGDSV